MSELSKILSLIVILLFQTNAFGQEINKKSLIPFLDESADTSLVHDAGNSRLAFSTRSQLGDGRFTPGVNAEWPINSGDEYLFIGSFWVGAKISGVPYVIGNQYGPNNNTWSQIAGSGITNAPGVSDQDIKIMYEDIDTLSIGLEVFQESYQWSDPAKDDFIIFNYTITNTGLNGSLDSLFASVFLDADIGASFQDLGGYDSPTNLLYLYDSLSTPSGFIGIKVLGSGNAPYAAIIYDVFENQYTDEWRYAQMTLGFPAIPGSAIDYNMLITDQPFDLPVGASHTVSFGIVFGNGLAELQTHTQEMENTYNTLLVGIDDPNSNVVPQDFNLHQNFPNPFNPSTTIKYEIAKTSLVKLEIYNILGHRIRTLVSRSHNPGSYQIEWDGRDSEGEKVTSGIYLYNLRTNAFNQTKKMIYLR